MEKRQEESRANGGIGSIFIQYNIVSSQSHGTVMKALEEDPDIFDYDGQYDKMQEEKRKSDPRLMKKDRNVRHK